MVRIRLLKFIDRGLGVALTRLLPGPLLQSRDAVEPETVLLVRPGGIGDAVHLVPAIRELRSRFPQISIDILAERRNGGVFALCPGIRRLYHYDRIPELLATLRNRYDVVVDTEQWHRLSAVFARLVRAPVKIGLATNDRVRMFTHPVAYSHDDYEVDTFLHLLAPLGIVGASSMDGPWLQVSQAAFRSMSLALAGDGSRPMIVLFPGASIAERRWGADNFHAVAKWSQDQGLRVVVVGGREDRDDAERIVGTLKALNLAGRTTLEETAAVLAGAAVVVCGDTGILHIAVGLGRPTVSLFGPGIAAKWAPKGPCHVVLNKKKECSPCTRFGYTPPCSHGVNCMRNITVNEVTSGISRLLRPIASKDSP